MGGNEQEAVKAALEDTKRALDAFDVESESRALREDPKLWLCDVSQRLLIVKELSEMDELRGVSDSIETVRDFVLEKINNLVLREILDAAGD